MAGIDLAAEWLAKNDPRHRDRTHPYPYHNYRQEIARRRREIPCGLVDTTAEHLRDAFRAAAARRPGLSEIL